MVEALLAEPEVELAGLAARDSLRLEAGLCLYGHDLDPTTSPVEAGLLWAIPAGRRHADAGYKGAAVVAEQVANGPSRRRVGLRPIGRRPVREGAELRCGDAVVGRLTSGGYSPVLGGPIAMGYVETAALDALGAGTARLTANVGDRSEPVEVAPLPFVAKTYRRAVADDHRSRP
jgi:aminomethyltransferase